MSCAGTATTAPGRTIALIVRAVPGWNTEPGHNRFTDPLPDAELWQRMGTLSRYGVARGYQDEVCRAHGKPPPCF